MSLLESYANVPPAILPKNDPLLPDIYKNILDFRSYRMGENVSSQPLHYCTCI